MFDPAAIIAKPLLQRIKNDEDALYRIVIELDTHNISVGAAFDRIAVLVKQALDQKGDRTEQHILSTQDDLHPAVLAGLQGKVVLALVDLDQQSPVPPGPLIHAIRRDVEDGRHFNPDNLIRSVISVRMLEQIDDDPSAVQSVLVEVNTHYARGRIKAKERVKELIGNLINASPAAPVPPVPPSPVSPASGQQSISAWKTDTSEQYVYARLTGHTIRKLVEQDQAAQAPPDAGDVKKGSDWTAIYHIWPDFKLRAQVWRSTATVKADACRRSFATTGSGIIWAVFDSGIDGNHPHFAKHGNLHLPSGLKHMDFTGDQPLELKPEDLIDEYGHGTHVAGIIAGELPADFKAVSLSREKDETGRISYAAETVGATILGVAPECTLLSYRVLDKNGEGEVSTVIAAIQKIQELNGYGRRILIHGVNMSLGYDFDPEWFACGQSPVCVEVDRLVRSGVAVVIAAGNTGKGFALTINDPGNAELAVTVGATHRDMPHRYGVSYFSSKGPTGDGRMKPDLLAPGERIISCGAGPDLQTYKTKAGVAPGDDAAKVAYYLERSGTSMAAPHVSGIIAGILSARGEFIGMPEELKALLVKNATDLGRDRNFQGGGLVDMMRTIQAV